MSNIKSQRLVTHSQVYYTNSHEDDDYLEDLQDKPSWLKPPVNPNPQLSETKVKLFDKLCNLRTQLFESLIDEEGKFVGLNVARTKMATYFNAANILLKRYTFPLHETKNILRDFHRQSIEELDTFCSNGLALPTSKEEIIKTFIRIGKERIRK
jgi:hypothetical protein